jgi:hypothetical protein
VSASQMRAHMPKYGNLSREFSKSRNVVYEELGGFL